MNTVAQRRLAWRLVSAVAIAFAASMVLTWILTFPGCGLLGFAMTKLFILIF